MYVLGLIIACFIAGCTSDIPEPKLSPTAIAVDSASEPTATPSSTKTVEPELSPSATSQPSSTLTLSLTDTPTKTPEPTSTPTATATPGLVVISDYAGPTPENALTRLGKGSVRQIIYNGKSILFSPDGSVIGISPSFGRAIVWDFTNDILTELEGHGATFSGSADFSEANGLFATSSSDGTIVLWELEPAEQ